MLRQSGDFFLTGHVSGSFKGEGRKPKEGGVGGGVGGGGGGEWSKFGTIVPLP